MTGNKTCAIALILALFLLHLACNKVTAPAPENVSPKAVQTNEPERPAQPDNTDRSGGPVRIGYFHGGRIHLLYRAYINNYFDNEKVEVKFLSKGLPPAEDKLFEVPKSHPEMDKKIRDIFYFGRVTGLEIVKEIEKGNLDGGTIGESSFLASIARGAPIIAVAMLGHDSKEKPGKGIVLRKGLKINSPEDLKDKTFTYRLSGPGDGIFLREFILSQGIKLDQVKIIDDMIDYKQAETLKSGQVDGGFYHFHWAKKFIEDDIGYLYRPMDWLNPEISHAVLVFHKDYLAKHQEEVQKIVNGYVKRIKYEKDLPEEELKNPREFGLQMVNEDMEEMTIPAYDLPPKMRLDLLEQMQDLLLKYGKASKKVRITDFIDDSFVDRAMESMTGK